MFFQGKGMMRTFWLIGKQSRKIENKSQLKQPNGTSKMNNLSNGFTRNNGKETSTPVHNMNMLNGLSGKNVVTRTSSLSDETSIDSSVQQAFLNEGFDQVSDSGSDDNDEREYLNVSREGRQTIIDMETSLMRGIARGSMKKPREYGGTKKSNHNFVPNNPATAAFC